MILPRLVRTLLYPFSVIYGRIVSLRASLYEQGWLKAKRLNGAVISVGNLTLGGTGKTPMVLWLAEKFLAKGKKAAILSRGYRGSGSTSDEIEVLKHRLGDRVRFGVGKNRFRAGHGLERENPVDVFLLDDGFQHLQLARDVNILMLDGSIKLKDQWLLPGGVLREPIAACRRANILIVTRKAECPDVGAEDSHEFSIFYAQTRLQGFRLAGNREVPSYVSEIGPGPFFAFCGLGNPEAFWSDLARWHVPLAGQKRFRDHHRYTSSDVRRLETAAEQNGAKAFITTEKDEQNLSANHAFKLPVYIVVIDFVLSSESEFLVTMERLLANRGVAA